MVNILDKDRILINLTLIRFRFRTIFISSPRSPRLRVTPSEFLLLILFRRARLDK
jgi:hypothetical protein